MDTYLALMPPVHLLERPKHRLDHTIVDSPREEEQHEGRRWRDTGKQGAGIIVQSVL